MQKAILVNCIYIVTKILKTFKFLKNLSLRCFIKTLRNYEKI